jgi:Mg-chelatase subunit ChlD
MTVEEPENQDNNEIATRWRLALGRYAGRRLPLSQKPKPGKNDNPNRQPTDDPAYLERLDQTLGFLYGREGPAQDDLRRADLSSSNLTVPRWLSEVRELFPREAAETLERDALQRYHLNELLTDPAVLEKIEPDEDLLKALLQMKGLLRGSALEAARRIARRVTEQIRQKLMREVYATLRGRLDRSRHSPVRIARNLDWRRTLRHNLKHYDPETGQLYPERFFFYSRSHKRRDWHIILCIDESGSMLDSIIQSAVMAGIFSALPSVKTNFIVFDTKVVDLSERVDDPVELLMSVQLGGGTDIGGALRYCADLVNEPRKTLLVLVTDFFEGAGRGRLVEAARALTESGVTVLGLAALSSQAAPVYDREVAGMLAEVGVRIGAYTPQKLAEEIVNLIR